MCINQKENGICKRTDKFCIRCADYKETEIALPELPKESNYREPVVIENKRRK